MNSIRRDIEPDKAAVYLGRALVWWMNARLFADRHLADVAGGVLVDSVSERQNLNQRIPRRARTTGAGTRDSDGKKRLTSGHSIVVTRNGRPVLDLVPHKPQRGLRLDALTEFKKRNGIKRAMMSIAADFDEPLPEDVLLKPLPPGE